MTSDTEQPGQLTPSQRMHAAMRNEREALQALLALFDQVQKPGIERLADDLQHALHSLAGLAAQNGNDIVTTGDAVSRYLQAHASTQLAHHAVNLTAQLERLEADTDGN